MSSTEKSLAASEAALQSLISDKNKEYTLAELTQLAEKGIALLKEHLDAHHPNYNNLQMDERRIRFYIQQGLIERPASRGRHARYHHRHALQIVNILRWQKEGYSLAKMRDLTREQAPSQQLPLEGEESFLFTIAEGFIVVASPKASGLSPSLLRGIATRTKRDYEKVLKRQMDMEDDLYDDTEEE